VRVLDLDLDFFLHGRPVISPPEGTRPTADSRPPWSTEEVRRFLEDQLGLNSKNRIPAAEVETHDEVFDLWLEQMEDESLVPGFDVVHIDAHADLSMGDPGWAYVFDQLLHLPVEERPLNAKPERCGLSEGNYLLFSIACRWLGSLTYVKKGSGTFEDLIRCLFRDRDPASGFIELPICRATDRRAVCLGYKEPIGREPAVPFQVVSGDDYIDPEPGRFDYAYLSVSPRYTPPEAEQLVTDVFEDYLDLGVL